MHYLKGATNNCEIVNRNIRCLCNFYSGVGGMEESSRDFSILTILSVKLKKKGGVHDFAIKDTNEANIDVIYLGNIPMLKSC